MDPIRSHSSMAGWSMNRRNFVKSSITGLTSLALGGSVISMTGCNVFQDIQTWIPIGLVAVQGIITVLGPLVPPQAVAIIVLIKAAFADLSAAITSYNNDTNPVDKSTLLAKIRTFLGDIVSNFQSFLNALNLGSNPIINVVVGLVNVVIAAVEGFMGQVPAAGPITPVTLTLNGRLINVTPKLYKNVADFKKDFNAVAIANGHSEIVIK
jgi:hypothetical protein